MHDILQGMQDSHEDGLAVVTTAERSATHNFVGNARKAMRLRFQRPRLLPGKIKDKEKGKAVSTASALSLAF